MNLHFSSIIGYFSLCSFAIPLVSSIPSPLSLVPGLPTVNGVFEQIQQLPVVLSYTNNTKYDALASNVISEIQRLKPQFNNFLETSEKRTKGFDSIGITNTSVTGLLEDLTFNDVKGAEMPILGEKYLNGKLTTGTLTVHGDLKYVKEGDNETKRFRAIVEQPITFDVTTRVNPRVGKVNIVSLSKISKKQSLRVFLNDCIEGGLYNSIMNRQMLNKCRDAEQYIEEKMKYQMENLFEKRLQEVLVTSDPLQLQQQQ